MFFQLAVDSIYIGTNRAPFLVDLFLYLYEAAGTIILYNSPRRQGLLKRKSQTGLLIPIITLSANI